MNILKMPLVARHMVAADTWETIFRIEDQKFRFSAGQYLTVTAPGLEQADLWERAHDFSVCSCPEELPLLAITFRSSASKFKRVLGSIPLGTTVEASGPKGYFTLPEDAAQPVCMVAGGIGVTPFMSMIRHSIRTGSSRPIRLYYFNRDERSSAYIQELTGYRSPISVHPVFGLFDGAAVPIDTESQRAAWYIAGPPAMILPVRSHLTHAGIPATNVRTEGFTGYV